jgi:hypothetical protein
MLTPNHFMRIVDSLPEKDRTKLESVWEEIFTKTITQHDLSDGDKIRYAIATAYLQAVYDELLTVEMSNVRRIIRAQ